jgi:hypothetical protein
VQGACAQWAGARSQPLLRDRRHDPLGDHNPPHFHATYQGRKVEIDIRSLAVLDGGIAPRALGLVMEWATAHQPELAEDWRLAADGREPLKIAPLA